MECLKNLMDERTEKALAELRETPEFKELLTTQEKMLDALLSEI